MKIAACDDDVVFLHELNICFQQYADKYNNKIEYQSFTNPLELVARIEKGNQYDVILLDIFMPGINGIQCAKDIRNFDNDVKIIFLTSSTEFAIESYDVRAYHYLVKPLQKEKLYLILKRLAEENGIAEKKVIIVKCKNGMVKITLSKLEYCEMVNRKIMLHMESGEKYECSMRMSEMEEKLECFEMFLRPHRSFFVNMDYIHTLTMQEILMESGIRIPVPREKYAWIKKTYMEYVFRSSANDV